MVDLMQMSSDSCFTTVPASLILQLFADLAKIAAVVLHKCVYWQTMYNPRQYKTYIQKLIRYQKVEREKPKFVLTVPPAVA